MDAAQLLENLNEPQREAVTIPYGACLVLAGAGSGKTRVLAHRICWLMSVDRVSPYSIMALTFTNKAAKEMRARIEQINGVPAGGMWVGTFHSIAHRLLRLHFQEANLPRAFQIMDSDDQQRLVKRVIRGMELDETKWPPKQATWFINNRKDEGLRPKHLEDHGDHVVAQMIKIYAAYEEACQRGGMVDFAELLLRSHELWLNNPELLKHYQARFQHVLVDEFQDTNGLQYAWIRLLAGEKPDLFVVGDDDQSIYGWRGARIENIQAVSTDFPGTRVIRLEQNYRSTANILNAANALISKNEGRLGKELWTADEDGDPIKVYSAFNDLEEARFIVERIKDWESEGNLRADCAILYRSNALSRVLEHALFDARMPYKVYGGLRFFERMEIKDALAYLRLTSNRHDDASFERVVNTPTRGVGLRSLEVVRQVAREYGSSLWDAANKVFEQKLLPARGANALQNFRLMIHKLAGELEGLALWEQVEHVVEASALVEHFKKDKTGKGEERIENLHELVNAARSFEPPAEDPEEPSVEMEPLDEFLANAALEAGEGQADLGEDSVQLMTLHSSKGLEFPLVFICGMEEGLFPSQMSLEEEGKLEEERRLAYVGITRAEKYLYLTMAESRRLYGRELFAQPSRFVGEVPQELIQDIRTRRSVQPVYTAPRYPQTPEPEVGLRLGQRVSHSKFGEGVVMNAEGSGEQARVQVNFAEAGPKWLVVAYANLDPVF